MGSIRQSVGQGRRQGLIALRDLLAEQIEEAEEPRQVSELAVQLRIVLRELDAVPSVSEVPDMEDALAARRAAKQAADG